MSIRYKKIKTNIYRKGCQLGSEEGTVKGASSHLKRAGELCLPHKFTFVGFQQSINFIPLLCNTDYDTIANTDSTGYSRKCWPVD